MRKTHVGVGIRRSRRPRSKVAGLGLSRLLSVELDGGLELVDALDVGGGGSRTGGEVLVLRVLGGLEWKSGTCRAARKARRSKGNGTAGLAGGRDTSASRGEHLRAVGALGLGSRLGRHEKRGKGEDLAKVLNAHFYGRRAVK